MRIAAAIAGIGLAVLISGCAPSTGSTSPTPSSPSPTASTTTTASPNPTTSPTPTASATVDPSAAVVAKVDPTLLEILPARVDDVDFVADPTTAADVAANPTLGRSVSALAMALAISTDATKEDVAIASVVQLRPGMYSDAFFVAWRASYDQAVCAQAGGVGTPATQVIGGHDTFVGNCKGGASTYHVHLTGDVLVSVTSSGPRHFGVLTISGLR